MVKIWYIGIALLILSVPTFAQNPQPTIQTNVSIVLARMGLDSAVEFVGVTNKGDALWARAGKNIALLEQNFQSRRKMAG